MRKADNVTAICERLSRQCGTFNISQPYMLIDLYTASGYVRFHGKNDICSLQICRGC
jgi:hypothetical protein